MTNFLDEINDLVQDAAPAAKPTFQRPKPVLVEVPKEEPNAPVLVPEPVQTGTSEVPAECNQAETIEISIAASAKYDTDDLLLILEIFMYDQPLQAGDLVTAAQARYYMSTRADGKIPSMMRKQLEAIHKKYEKQAARR